MNNSKILSIFRELIYVAIHQSNEYTGPFLLSVQEIAYKSLSKNKLPKINQFFLFSYGVSIKK